MCDLPNMIVLVIAGTSCWCAKSCSASRCLGLACYDVFHEVPEQTAFLAPAAEITAPIFSPKRKAQVYTTDGETAMRSPPTDTRISAGAKVFANNERRELTTVNLDLVVYTLRFSAGSSYLKKGNLSKSLVDDVVFLVCAGVLIGGLPCLVCSGVRCVLGFVRGSSHADSM